MLRWMRHNLFMVCTLFAVAVGVTVGITLRDAHFSPTIVQLIGLPGVLFLNTLKAMLVPLIMCCLVSSLTKLDSKSSGKLAVRTVLYIAFSTGHAVILGSLLALLIHPGDPSIKRNLPQLAISKHASSAMDSFTDLLRNVFPDNLVHSMFAQQKTISSWSNDTHSFVSELKWVEGINMLGLIAFSILLGVVIGQAGEQARILIDFFNALDMIIIRMMRIIIWFGVIGIPSMIVQKLLEVADVVDTIKTLGLLIVTTMLGLAIMAFITLPTILYLCTRKNPFTFMRYLGDAYISVLATSSCVATLPVTIKCVDDSGIDPRVNRLLIPLMTMLSSIGTALYEAVAPIFIAQINGVTLSIPQIFTLWIMGSLASLGCSTVPSAGLITMMAVLSALGLPTTDMPLIFTLEWFVDRFRSTVNMMGHTFGTKIIHDLCIEDLKQSTKPNQQETPVRLGFERVGVSPIDEKEA